MALIAAIFASLAGIIAGILGTVLFGASLVLGVAIYVVVSLGMIAAFAVSMLWRARLQGRAAVEAREDELDADWIQFGQEQAFERDHARGQPQRAATSADEERFEQDLQTHLSADDSRRKGERRRSDRRGSG